MATLSFSVDYMQTANTPAPGEIGFEGGNLTTTVTASGRLDAVGDTVISPTFGVVLSGDDRYNVTVEVTRTSSSTMRFVVVFELDNMGGAYYGGCEHIEKTIDDVPITF